MLVYINQRIPIVIDKCEFVIQIKNPESMRKYKKLFPTKGNIILEEKFNYTVATKEEF